MGNKLLKIDLNCDVGEGLANEHLLMPYISSCNISCGAHAGTIEIIDNVIALALENKVKIGAHPSFPDRANFGRLVMDISEDALLLSLQDQLRVFKERAVLQNATVHHVKPHGALYNLIAVNEKKAELVVKAVKSIFDNVKLYVPYNSKIEQVAKSHGLKISYEAFADRNYNDDLTLVSRELPNAIITDVEQVVSHVKSMAIESKVNTVQGASKEIKAQTFCVHGDNEKAIELLKGLNALFEVQ